MGRKVFKAQVPEEVKLTVSLTLKKLQMSDDIKELAFPSSLTSEERKYIHQSCLKMGFKSKSRGKGSARYLTIYKKEGSSIISREALLNLCDGSRAFIMELLTRWPVTNKERQDLLPGTEKDRLMNPELRDLTLTRSLGRLTPGPPQVPPQSSRNELTVDARKLPVWDLKEQIMSAVLNNQIVLIRGETGSGKTTQIPQMLLEAATAEGRPLRILCTQPRRISTLSIADRVASERGEKLGYTVGYQIRLEGKLSAKTLLVFCTTGVLLRTLMGGESALSTVTHIIIDEVHERDRFTDFLLTVLRDCLPRFRQLKLILMSANLDSNLYVKYFNGCPVVDVPGRAFPVKLFYLEDVLKLTKYSTSSMMRAQEELKRKKEGLTTVAEWSKIVMNTLTETKNKTKDQSEKLKEKKEEEKSGDLDSNAQMDLCLEHAFRTGDEEYFSQMLYLILSENVSVDYQHSSTWASPLMVCAGRGRLDTLEHLLAIGANVNLRAANDWTAFDWAKSTDQTPAFEMLKNYSIFEGLNSLQIDSVSQLPQSTPCNDEDMQLLQAYCNSRENVSTDANLVYTLCLKIHKDQPMGGILIFLTGYEDIVTLKDMIMSNENQFLSAGKFSLFCLHSSMQTTDQKRVFRSCPTGVRKIVLATNIAETSITINDIVYVIDCALVKEVSYDSMSGISCLQTVPISQSSANQRRGRAGRCKPGICYHLFSRANHSRLQVHTTPEILRVPLQDLCLHTKLLAAPNMLIADFLARAPEPPAFIAVKNAVHTLKSMDALDPWEDVTELGHHLLDLPLPPHLGKMVIIATILKCLDPVLTIATCLAYKDPFQLPITREKKEEAKNIRKLFACGTYSDHMVLLNAYQSWQRACGEHWNRSWCERHFISGPTMEMLHGTRSQVMVQLRNSGFIRPRGPGDIRDVNMNSDNWPMVKCALASGYYPNLMRVDRERQQLRTEKESKIQIHLSSVIHDLNAGFIDRRNYAASRTSLVEALPSDWLIYNEMQRSTFGDEAERRGTAQVKTVTLISPLSVMLMAGPMRMPFDAVSQPSNKGSLNLLGESSSDSESEDRPVGMNTFIRVDPWIQFLTDLPTASLCLQLRHKLHSLILRRLRAPSKPIMPADDDVIRAIAIILFQEEKFFNLPQPVNVEANGALRGEKNGQPEKMGYFNIKDLPQSYTAKSQKKETPVVQPKTSQVKKEVNTNAVVTHSNASVSLMASLTAPANKSPVTTSAAKPNTTTTASSTLTTKASTTVSSVKSKIQSKDTKATSTSNGVTKGGNKSSDSNGAKSNAAASSTLKNNSSGRPHYYIVRVTSFKQIEVSQSKGVWSLAYSTERKLTQATQAGPVILIFALNRSNQFHGFAKFAAQKTSERCPELTYFGPPTGNLYKVEWIKKWPIHFHQTRHLLNPYTDNLQVHMCCDGQEVEPNVGDQLTRLWDKPNLNNSGASSSSRYDTDSQSTGPPHLSYPHPHMQRPYAAYYGANYNNGAYPQTYMGAAYGGKGTYRGGYRR